MLSAGLFVLLFVTGCLFAFIRHPIYGLLVYVGTFYVHPPSRWWGQGWMLDVRWSYLAALVTAIAVLARRPNPGAPPFFKHPFVLGLAVFIGWILVQFPWVLDHASHVLLANYYVKYLLVLYLMYRCLDSPDHVRLFLWAHVAGCFYFGWIAFTEYTGGRFEGFGGPGLSEANVAAMTLVTGALGAGGLFIASQLPQRLMLLAAVPFIANGVVTTISRSAFLAAAVGAVVFNVFAPPAWKGRVKLLSIIAAVGFLSLTTDAYWNRIETVQYKGAEVEGWDSSGGRLAVMDAQFRIAKAYPLGCGHSCTEFLSPSYIAEEKLNRRTGTRASHNSFLSFLVDQGIPGAIAYILMVVWVFRGVLTLSRHVRSVRSEIAPFLPAVTGALGAIVVGDMFVPYVRYEVRFWFIGLLIALLTLAGKEGAVASSDAEAERNHVSV